MSDAVFDRSTVGSVVELLELRSATQPDTVGYTFLDGEREHTFTYAELDRRARDIASAVRQQSRPGDRVVLLLPPGLDYVAAFFGCLYAGAVAVPVYPPGGSGPARSLARLESIISDADPTVAMTLSAAAERIDPLAKEHPRIGQLHWIFVDDLDGSTGAEPNVERAGPHDLAFLQYTSGSTALPKGVMVSHGNLLHNGADIERFFDLNASSKTIIWLPPYHDMGLIGGILQPLYTGYPTVLMSPSDFTRQPLRWLRAIADHRGTTSGGPSFAYELCVRKISPEQLGDLDLSCWRLAFNGAEPIRADVLDRFAELLAPTGFRRDAFYPCYGLAEGTLIVTGGRPYEPPLVHPRTGLVGCGQVSPAQRLVVADPVTRRPVEVGAVGEIWVSGPSVASGYWGRPQETEETFLARLSGSGDGPFLRTGDLGFLDGGELYVTGRIKDLIIQRGVNHYPQDIEITAGRAHRAMQPNGGAAFSLAGLDTEQLVVAHEVARGHEDTDLDEVIDAVRAAVGEGHLLAVHAVVLVRARSLPRTSSGKIQRHAARERYLGGGLDVLACRVFDTQSGQAQVDADDGRDVGFAGGREDLVVALLRREVARRVRIDPDQVDLRQTGPALGLDSVGLFEIQHELETTFGVELSPDSVHGASLGQVIESVTAAMAEPTPRRGAPPDEARHRLGYGQQGLWFLDRMTSSGAAYNLAGAVRLPVDIDVPALERAVVAVIDRHKALRTTFVSKHGEPVRQVNPCPDIVLAHETFDDWSPRSVEDALADLAMRAFDLEHGPLLRVHLCRAAGREPLLLLTIHHIVSDFWSLGVLLSELVELYQGEVSGERPQLPPPGDYDDYVAWQRDYLDSAAGRADAAYWSRQLSGELPLLDLPTDRPRPALQSFRGGQHTFAVDAELVERLRELARSCGTTLYVVLLSAYGVLLHRYTGQTDVLVGSPTSGRARSRFAQTIGYLVNPVVVRANLTGNPTFRSVLRRLDRTVADALAHQDFPFGRLAELVAPGRDPSRSPVFQTMFIHHQSSADVPAALGQLAAGQAGAGFEIAGLDLEPVPLPQRTAQFDLTLTTAVRDNALAASLRYNTDLVDEATAADLADSLVTLLRGLVDAPDTTIAAVPVLSVEKRRALLDEWNDTARPISADLCVHQAFAAKAAEQPDAVAVVFRSQQLTYRELDACANRVAARLARLGVGAEDIVGLCVDRSPEMLAGILGILKSGAAYLPLDPEYPAERLGLIMRDADTGTVLTRRHLIDRLSPSRAVIVDLDEVTSEPGDVAPICAEILPDHAAYVLYTSGTTGTPKGVVVSHRNVINFFAGMDERVGCDERDTLLAVTSMAFDISVLELLWTLTRGARVLVVEDRLIGRTRPRSGAPSTSRHLDFSLFYFASTATATGHDKFRLVLDGARFADRNGFAAVWTPERHFHEFGGLYPNPSVMSAALATITENVHLRAGSVVLPLHSPIRVAEEWAVVDNLSGGRVGIAFASGWHADDFAFFPDRFSDRKQHMYEAIRTVHALWRGESITVRGGSGSDVDVRIHPVPMQPTLPTWITAAGSPETFTRAGEIGANVLTHLLGQTPAQVATNIGAYRAARARHGHPGGGHVTLMLHTFIGTDTAAVRALVKRPFTAYLRSSIGLIENLVRSLDLPLDLATISESDMNDLLEFAFNRYFSSSALFGTPESVQPMIEHLKAAGVDEIACLIDFGLPEEVVLAHLPNLAAVRRLAGSAPRHAAQARAGDSIAAQLAVHRPTLLQTTPSVLQMLTQDADNLSGLRSLRALLLGGEALPAAVANTVRDTLPARLINMYGPTETTVWSATHEVCEPAVGTVPLGTPIANTQIHVVNAALEPAPVGVVGELVIGGLGVSRGYWNSPDLTAERFVPDPFGRGRGGRLYRTGDLARRRADGTIEFLGRVDRQVKVRGMRIELGDVESALCRVSGVRNAVVVAREAGPGDVRLVGYVVPDADAGLTSDEVREHLRAEVPGGMVPSTVVLLPNLPMTANGKVDVRALPAPEWSGARPAGLPPAPPTTELERQIAAIWREMLQVDTVGRHDNFFDLGGHSLLMVHVHARLQSILQWDVPLIKLLEHPTISSLASFLTEAPTASESLTASRERAHRQRASRDARRPPSGRSGA